MNPKHLNFLAMCWFISTIICLVLEGSWMGTGSTSIINELSVIKVYNLGGILPVPLFNIYFFHGLARLLLWDYSFYQGGWEIIKWFWIASLDPGAIWGIGSALAYVYGSLVGRF